MKTLPEILEDETSDEFRTSVLRYLESQGAEFEADEYELFAHNRDLAAYLKENPEDSPESRLLLLFLLEAWGLNSNLILDEARTPMIHGWLDIGLALLASHPQKALPTPAQIAERMVISGLLDWSASESGDDAPLFASAASEFAWKQDPGRVRQLCLSDRVDRPLVETLVQRDLDQFRTFLEKSMQSGETVPASTWLIILESTDQLDSLFIRSLSDLVQVAQQSPRDRAVIDFLRNVAALFAVDREDITTALVKAGRSEPFHKEWLVLVHVANHLDDEELLDLVADGIKPSPDLPSADRLYEKLLDLAFANLDAKRLAFLGETLMKTTFDSWGYRTGIIERLLGQAENEGGQIKTLLLEKAEEFSAADKLIFWELVAGSPLFAKEMESLISHSSVGLREAGAKNLLAGDREAAFDRGCALLTGRKINERLGGILLLQDFGDRALPFFKEAFDQEKSAKVRDLLEQLIGPAESGTGTDQPDPGTLVEGIKKDKRLKLPRVAWLSADDLILYDPQGKPLPEALLAYLVKWQLKHKEIEACPEIRPLLPLLAHPGNHRFASALLRQWLASDQAAKDRWVLTLTGLLGDDTVVPPLSNGIKRWAKAKRKELAACAARTLGLLGSDVALSTLDEVAQTFRQKGANVGRAASETLLAATKARGVSLEELRDAITPTLGFDAEGGRVMEDDGFTLHARLQTDGSLTWLDPTTGKTTKNPPTKTPAGLKKDITAFKALLRDTWKGQTRRLELALVTQRRWAGKKWQELFGHHPLLSRLSSAIVWASYENHQVTTTFRRFENGILATSDGEMLDAEDLSGDIGMVHPGELSADDLAAWRTHLERQQVTPLFPQIDRSFFPCPEDEANRREIREVAGVRLDGSTFLSRAERLGWLVSGRIEGGMIPSVYKEFPTHQLEVNLEVDELSMAELGYCDAVLGSAHFVKLGTFERGEYACDLPKDDDPRVLAFGEVPPIVYSEGLKELKNLVAGLSSS
jgi:hypothetical protein